MNVLKMFSTKVPVASVASNGMSVIPATPRQESDGVSDLLVYYMKQYNELTEENACLKASLATTQSEAEGMLVANAAMKAALESSRKKSLAMERKLVRLAAIEKVWKETFSKMQLSMQPIPVTVMSLAGDGPNLNVPDEEYVAAHEALLEGIEDLEDDD